MGQLKIFENEEFAKYMQMDTTRRNISMIQQNRTKWQYICEIKYMSFQKSEEDE